MIKKVLVTGACGFIGFNLSLKLLHKGYRVVGVDNLNSYYDVNLKKDRLRKLQSISQFVFHQFSISDSDFLSLCKEMKFDVIINLAAQAGVRYSIENPDIYIDSNICGFYNVLKAARESPPEHLIFASTSSVYGLSDNYPYTISDPANQQASLYAATKKSNESLAHSYSYMYGIPITGLRFFTVYGPWGRPDMAIFLFTKSIIEGEEIRVFNHGNLWRDFTYIDDVTESISRLISKPPLSQEGKAPYSIYNVGNGSPIKLINFIESLESALGQKAVKHFEDSQLGDVFKTYADSSHLEEWIGFAPKTSLEKGINLFVEWYRSYYQVLKKT